MRTGGAGLASRQARRRVARPVALALGALLLAVAALVIAVLGQRSEHPGLPRATPGARQATIRSYHVPPAVPAPSPWRGHQVGANDDAVVTEARYVRPGSARVLRIKPAELAANHTTMDWFHGFPEDFRPGSDVYWGFSRMVPADPPARGFPEWFYMCEINGWPYRGQAPFHLGITRGGHWIADIYRTDASGTSTPVARWTASRWRPLEWRDFVLHWKVSKGDDGVAELWTKLATERAWTKATWSTGGTVYRGPTMPPMAIENHPLMGLYGDPGVLGYSAYSAHDAVGTAPRAVAPR